MRSLTFIQVVIVTLALLQFHTVSSLHVPERRQIKENDAPASASPSEVKSEGPKSEQASPSPSPAPSVSVKPSSSSSPSSASVRPSSTVTRSPSPSVVVVKPAAPPSNPPAASKPETTGKILPPPSADIKTPPVQVEAGEKPVANNPSSGASDNGVAVSTPPSKDEKPVVAVEASSSSPISVPPAESKNSLPILQGAVAPGPSGSASDPATSPEATGDAQAEPIGAPEASGASKSSSAMPIIIGGVIGGILTSILAVLGLVMWCRRTRRKETGAFRDLMWRRKSANLFFSQAATPSMMESRDPESLVTSRIPAYPFHEKYSGYGSSDVAEPVSPPHHQQLGPTPLFQSFTSPAPVQPPAIMTTPPSPPQHMRDLSVDTTALTVRQTQLKREMAGLQERLEAKPGTNLTGNSEADVMRARIEFLQGLMTTPWALGQTAVAPEGLYA